MKYWKKKRTPNMQYKKLGLKWFAKFGAPHQIFVTVDRNLARTPQLFILQERYVHSGKAQSETKL